ncbi:MAG: exodeoxyribonuclease V subunit gamma, partial [Muribaculaceae bacterium]|nr:exodeoxyribonuclease V subunit gamma [Muribaculaceae bacterium]
VGVNGGTKKKLTSFAELIQLFIKDAQESDAYQVGKLIYNRTGILTSLAHDNTPESISKQENLSELLSGLKDFVDARVEEGVEDVSMQAFLSDVMLATDQDKEEDSDEAKVTLMTVHAAKGLEFKHIFIVGVEEELFPSSMSMDTLAQIEEERRLLYVAITRAKETCTITYAGSRFRNGQTVMSRPSRFLSEIDPSYLKMVSSVNVDDVPKFVNPVSNYRSSYSASSSRSSYQSSPSSRNSYSSLSSFSSSNYSAPKKRVSDLSGAGSAIKAQHSASELKIGVKIEHPKLGIGKVTAIGNVSGEESITVDFGNIGIKKLLLRFAKFKIL